ncbi:MAG TPA: response regulator [Anaeromyxobacteraceae bacterium]|nr:response regulator [Anaeromyxobacteraceae bacterium]
MGDLARILVQSGVLTPEGATRAVQMAREGDVASSALELRLADEPSLVGALARFHECPGVDLSKCVLPVAFLSVVTPEFCHQHRVLPVQVGKSEVVLAMWNPDDLSVADEVRFLTGKNVLRYVAVGTAIVRALEGLAQARRDGASSWRGERALAPKDPSVPQLGLIRPTDRSGAIDVPEATESMEVVGLSELLMPFQPAPPPPPRSAPQRPAAKSAEPSTLRLEGLAVGKVALVADDDPGVRQLVATVLSKMGCIVMQAGDGKTALEMVRDAQPDLVVLDAMMPGMHGFDVCRVIKGDRNLRTTRVVLCSAIYRGTVGTDAQVAFGADAFIEKPFRLEEITRVFKVALVGPVAAESPQERAAREESQGLWRAASEALSVGRIPQAVDLARQAASKDPWSAEAHYYLGQALLRQGLLFEAVAAYERAAELRPDVDATHQCLAQAYERLGFQKSAREAWGRAVETCKDPARRRSMQERLMALLGG